MQDAARVVGFCRRSATGNCAHYWSVWRRFGGVDEVKGQSRLQCSPGRVSRFSQPPFTHLPSPQKTNGARIDRFPCQIRAPVVPDSPAHRRGRRAKRLHFYRKPRTKVNEKGPTLKRKCATSLDAAATRLV